MIKVYMLYNYSVSLFIQSKVHAFPAIIIMIMCLKMYMCLIVQSVVVQCTCSISVVFGSYL